MNGECPVRRHAMNGVILWAHSSDCRALHIISEGFIDQNEGYGENGIVWYFSLYFRPDCLCCCGLLVRNLCEVCGEPRARPVYRCRARHQKATAMENDFGLTWHHALWVVCLQKSVMMSRICSVVRNKISGAVCFKPPDKIFLAVPKIFAIILLHFLKINPYVDGWWGHS